MSSDELRRQSQIRMLPQEHVDYLHKLKKVYGFSPRVVYDIGSNLLHWTNEARAVWPDSTYVLFDATDSLEFLYQENAFTYHMGVLSNISGREVTFYQNDMSTGGNSYYRENEMFNPDASFLYDDSKSRKLTAMTLDDVVSSRQFPSPTLVKIDVQGAELDIIRGAQLTLANCTHLIVELRYLEYNLGAPEASEIIEFLEEIGFISVGKFCSNEFDADFHFINTNHIQH